MDTTTNPSQCVRGPRVPVVPRARMLAGLCALSTLVIAGCGGSSDDSEGPVTSGPALVASRAFPVIHLDPRFRIEKVAEGLTYVTSMAWDGQGRMYVLEAGGGFLEEPPPARILRVESNGSLTQVVELTSRGVADSAVGLAFHQGAFYVSHRDANDRTGAVSRVSMDGTVTQILTGIVDSQSEHQVNDLRVGPDGRMYLASGPATNAGVVGLDLAPFVSRSPMVHHRPCQNIVLTGQNFQTPDFRTKDDPSDVTRTGAFVPFGTETSPGQVIPGVKKCGGAILAFDPNNAEATVQPYATGFRNIIGMAWAPDNRMFAAVNGYDIRGSRSVNDQWDATYEVRAGTWYGWPDFSAALEPVTDPKFDDIPESQKAPVFVNGVPQGKPLRFLIDHAASGLRAPDRALVHGLHEFNSSPSLIDVAPASWGDLAGQVFTAEWGDLAPATNPLRDGNAGFMISRINPAAGKQRIPFVRNEKRGPASAQQATGRGLERPFGVRFGPDGAMYVTDYGIARVNPARTAQGQVPYEFPPQTGAIWRVKPAR